MVQTHLLSPSIHLLRKSFTSQAQLPFSKFDPILQTVRSSNVFSSTSFQRLLLHCRLQKQRLSDCTRLRSKTFQYLSCALGLGSNNKTSLLYIGTMELHDDLKNFPNLQHLLGTGLYTELFDDQASSVTDNEKPEDPSQISEDLPFPADTDTNILPSDYQYVCQQSQLKGHGNPQTFHGLSVLQFGLHPNNFQSFQAMACPLNIDAYPEPVFDCDCGEKFDNLGSMITHRENDIQHKPWHGIWKVQGQGVCLCGRCFTNEPALRRHIRMANASIRRQRWVNGERDTKVCLSIPQLTPNKKKPRKCRN